MPLSPSYLEKVASESTIKDEGTRAVFVQVHYTIDKILIELWGRVLGFEGDQFTLNIPIDIAETIRNVKKRYPNPNIKEYLRCDTIEEFISVTKNNYEHCGWRRLEVEQNKDGTYQFTFYK